MDSFFFAGTYHGGQLWYEAAQGGGANFIMELPANRQMLFVGRAYKFLSGHPNPYICHFRSMA
jgi:hypothetical protein